MKLIVGLGNPGKKYNDTRHNVGFNVVDVLWEKYSSVNFQFADQLSSSFKNNRKLQSKVFELKDLKIILAKPTTYMNESGEAVRKLVNFYKVRPSRLWVVHDDLDLSFGSHKIQKGKGPKDHNGLNSIYKKLGLKGFWHVRMGVDNRSKDEKKISGEKYVLMKLKNLEQEVRDEMVEKAVGELLGTLKAG